MDINTLNLFDRVIIQEWGNVFDNRVGIVDFISHGVVGLVTIQNPTHFYIVSEWNKNNIKKIN